MPDREDQQSDNAYIGPTIPIRRLDRPPRQPAPPLDPPPRRPAVRPRRAQARSVLLARLRTAALILLGLVGIGLLLSYLQIRDLAAQTVVRDARSGVFSLSPAAPFTMLLIGVDERPDHPEEGVRSDTLIVARIDPAGRWMSLLSIPRDTLVPVRELGASRIDRR